MAVDRKLFLSAQFKSIKGNNSGVTNYIPTKFAHASPQYDDPLIF